MKERSIFDNIFTFWESIAVAKHLNEDLAILLLDFEKAYDRVDWNFLQGTLQRLGFEDSWINGVSALYSSASSRVLLAGDKGRRFFITRSIRQGCPLAPFLFLFFAEALHMYLAGEHVGLKGLQISECSEQVLDQEFADDTSLYLQGQVEKLQKAKQVLQVFCSASGTLINWHKTFGF